VDACAALADAVHGQQAGGGLSVPLVAYLKGATGGFKISNVSIVKAVMQLATAAAGAVKQGERFSKAAAWELIKAFGDKFSDKKTLEISNAMCTALCEAVGPSFVIKRMKVGGYIYLYI
jgi:hypothetical protein